MLCDRCKKQNATTYYKQVINGKVKEYHLCDDCAAEMGTFSYQPFSGLFGGLFAEPTYGDSFESINETRCPGCGMTYREIAESGRVGCGKCYETFRDRMRRSLENIHGKTKHVGRRPGVKVEQKTEDPQIQNLKKEMEKAIQEQNFEEAARLRDEIKGLEGKDNAK